MICVRYSLNSWEELEQFLEEAVANGYHWIGETAEFDGVAFLESRRFSVETGSLSLWDDGDITYEPVDESTLKKYIPGELPELQGGNHEG